jgi:hypothetical protein
MLPPASNLSAQTIYRTPCSPRCLPLGIRRDLTPSVEKGWNGFCYSYLRTGTHDDARRKRDMIDVQRVFGSSCCVGDIHSRECPLLEGLLGPLAGCK